MTLPCNHIFFGRKIKRLSIFDEKMVSKRLKLNYNIDSLECIPSGSNVIEIPNLNSIESFGCLSKMSTTAKYNAVFRPAQELCQSLIHLPQHEFVEKFKLFLIVKELFENKIDFIPTILNTLFML